jgi:large subunit ribosomal protein L15
MMQLHTLENTHRPAKSRKRLGRGTSSGHGKTCGRGYKGAGSRSGWKSREGKEGGQFPLFMKLPIRGFNNTRFQHRLTVINLWQVEKFYTDGETVDEDSLRQKGLIKGDCLGIKLLADGELTKKKVTLKVDAISSGAREKLDALGVSYTVASYVEPAAEQK